MRLTTRFAATLLTLMAALTYITISFAEPTDSAFTKGGADSYFPNTGTISAFTKLKLSEDDGSPLVKLWTRHQKALEKDLPKQQKQILDEILDESLRQKLPLDYYEASVLYVQTLEKINWRDKDKASEYVLDKGLGHFGPLVDYLLKTGPVGKAPEIDEILGHKAELQNQYHSDIYNYLNDSHGYYSYFNIPQFVINNISNDYEFVLWHIYQHIKQYSHTKTDDSQRVLNLLEEQLGTRYPNGTYTQLRKIIDCDDNQELINFEKKYSDKPISLFATYEILKTRRDSLFALSNLGKTQKRSASAQMRALVDDCKSAEKTNKTLKKQLYGEILPFGEIVQTIESKNVYVCQKMTEIDLITRNIPYLEVELRRDSIKGPLVISQRLDNSEKSCYYLDTLRFTLPKTDDGDYVLSLLSKDYRVNEKLVFSRLSAANINTEKGRLFYLCDAVTGEPLEEANVCILSGKDTVKVLQNQKFAGWTDLKIRDLEIEKAAQKDLGKSYHEWLRVVFQTEDKDGFKMECSQNFSSRQYLNQDWEGRNGKVLTDRAAYTPGDTIRFKVICWKENETGPFAVEGSQSQETSKTAYSLQGRLTSHSLQGRLTSYSSKSQLNSHSSTEPLTSHFSKRPKKVVLTDFQGKVVAEKALKLNAFGSAAGEFVVPRGSRNGSYYLTLSDAGNTLAGVSLQVDEYVLPDFEIRFAEDKTMKFLGDSLTIRGLVKSYTGHPLAEARAEYELTLGNQGQRGKLELEPNGAFKIHFNTAEFSQKNYLQCSVTVRITDASGKSEESTTYRFLSKDFGFDEEFLDGGSGIFELSGSDLSVFGVPESERHVYVRHELTDRDVLRFVVDRQLAKLSESEFQINYLVKHHGEVIASGKTAPGDTLSVDLKGYASGLYGVELEALTFDGRGCERRAVVRYLICRVKETDRSVDAGIERVFRKIESSDVAFQLGVGDGPVWAMFFVIDGSNVLESKIIHIDKCRASQVVSIPWQEDWPEVVSGSMLYFRNGKSYFYTESFRRNSINDRQMPLSLSMVRNIVSPRQVCTLNISGLPESECVVSVFDKRTETIRPNHWFNVRSYARTPFLELNIDVPIMSNRGGIIPYHSKSVDRMPVGTIQVRGRNGFGNGVFMEEAFESDAIASDNVSDAVSGNISYAASGNVSDVVSESCVMPLMARENFARTLLFEPFVRTSGDGRAELSFVSGDELSTFVVSVFAHNKLMYNNVARSEFVVTIPVKVGVNLPQYIYETDLYNMAVSLTNSSDQEVEGDMICEVYGSEDYKSSKPVAVFSKPISVVANGGAKVSFSMNMQELATMLDDEIFFKLLFQSSNYSDAVFVKLPVWKAEQTLTEAHSLIQSYDMSDDEAYERLAGEFIGTSPYGATFSVKTVRDIISDFYFNLHPNDSFDALSQVRDLHNALNAKMLYLQGFDKIKVSDYLKTPEDSTFVEIDKFDEIIRKSIKRLMKCGNDDGGFAWVPGMKSNVFVTNYILGVMARIAEDGLWEGNVADSELGTLLDRALQYIENEYFRVIPTTTPDWRNWSADYLVYRSSIGSTSPWTGKTIDSPIISKKLRKKLIASLTDISLTHSNISAKLNNIYLIFRMLENDSAFIRSCGFSEKDCKNLKKSAAMNMSSLLDYAVKSSYGAYYYPSFSGHGISEIELYPRAVYIFNRAIEMIFSDGEFVKLFRKYNSLNNNTLSKLEELRDGLYLWMLMQKESQSWRDNPYYFNVIHSILSAPSDIQDTKVAILSKTYTKPFSAIRPASSGMNLSVKYYRRGSRTDLSDVRNLDTLDNEENIDDNNIRGLVQLRPGDRLEVGEKIVAFYKIESENARSLVRLTAARPACLRPIEQLSGYDFVHSSSDWAVRMFTHSCYREVKADKTVFWIDTLPEGQMELVEELIVTQEGSFSAAASELVCEYAPNYRANTAAQSPLIVMHNYKLMTSVSVARSIW